VVTVPGLPDFDELALRLVQLRHRESDLARRISLEEDRQRTFGSDYAQRALTGLRAEVEPIRAEIAALEEQLRPVLRKREPQ
jgi:hypothetical protein